MAVPALVLDGDYVRFSVPLGVLLGLDPAFSQGKAGYSEGVIVLAANNAKCIYVSSRLLPSIYLLQCVSGAFPVAPPYPLYGLH